MRSNELTKGYLREYRICSQRPGIRIHELVVEMHFRFIRTLATIRSSDHSASVYSSSRVRR